MKRSTTAVIVGVLALGLVGGGTAVALTGQDDPTPEALPIDALVEVVFDDVTETITLPKFRLVQQ